MITTHALLKKRKTIAPNARRPEPSNPTMAARQHFANAAQLLHGNDPRAFYDELFKALQGWLSIHLSLSPAQMNQADVSAQLRKRGATAIRAQALLSVWHICEQAVFGGQMQAEQMESTWHTAQQVLSELEKEMKYE